MVTLDQIVDGLNKAGFSDKDYKVADPVAFEEATKKEIVQQVIDLPQPDGPGEDITSDIDHSRLSLPVDSIVPDTAIDVIEEAAIEQTRAFEETVAKMEAEGLAMIPVEIKQQVKTYSIKEVFYTTASSILLPQFYEKISGNDLFGEKEEKILLEKESLLKGFPLSREDANINFDTIDSELYKIDLDETSKEHVPSIAKLDGNTKEYVLAYILNPSQKDSRVKNYTRRITRAIGTMDPIPEKEIEKYITKILEDFTDEQFIDLANNEYTYTEKIRQKIRSLSESFAEKRFSKLLDTDQVFIEAAYHLPKLISAVNTAKSITRSLYEKEASMNGFEERVINDVANMSNIEFWTRNIDRRGFRINGFINHYPDFIIQTKSGKTVLLETKGDHLDAEQKIRLGKLWAQKAGNSFRYFMVYEKRDVPGAYTLDEFITIIREI